jgi:hypothetical protein
MSNETKGWVPGPTKSILEQLEHERDVHTNVRNSIDKCITLLKTHPEFEQFLSEYIRLKDAIG